MVERDNDDQLFLRLRRIAAVVGSLTPQSDRCRLLAVRSELLRLRSTIVARCDALADDMRANRAQLGAIAAYSRCARVPHGTSKTPTNGRTTGN